MADAVVARPEGTLLDEWKVPAVRRPTTTLEAYDLYLKDRPDTVSVPKRCDRFQVGGPQCWVGA